MRRVISCDSMGTPSSMPKRCSRFETHSLAKMRIRSSSSDEIEARGAGIALAAGASAKLVVDAARFVTLGAENVQAAGSNHFVVFFVGLLLYSG